MVKRLLWYFVNVLFFINPLNPSSKIKVVLLRAFGAKIGKGVRINPSVNIKYPWQLAVGDFSWIGEKVWIDNLVKVTIGSHCCISQGALLLTGNHNYKSARFDLMVGEIVLEDGVWIGAKALVGPGVICKSHAVLSIASATSINLEPYTIYRGNPALPTKKRSIS